MAFSSTTKPNSPLAYHRVLSPSASIKVSPLCLGTMNFGDIWKDMMGECTKTTTFQILDHFYASGGNFIDTANMYMNGESEEWIGEWMSLRNVRDELVVATKFSMTWKMSFMEPAGHIFSNFGGNNRKSLKLSLKASLERLRTDYVDILYVHSWDPTATIPELMHALDDVVTSGKALYLGVSNWPAWAVSAANGYARANGLNTFVVYEGRWNAAERDIEKDVLHMCKAEGMGITVWSALGSGKFKSNAQLKEGLGRTADTSHLGTAADEIFEQARVALQSIADRKNAPVTAVALRYVMLKAPYVFPICGGRKLDHIKENIEALNLNLSDEDINEIEMAVPFDLGYPHTLLSGSRTQQVSAANPGMVINTTSAFSGVEEPRAIH